MVAEGNSFLTNVNSVCHLDHDCTIRMFMFRVFDSYGEKYSLIQARCAKYYSTSKRRCLLYTEDIAILQKYI